VTADWRTYYRAIWMTSTPTQPLDGMTLVQFNATREALRGALAKFEAAAPTCHRCKFFQAARCEKFDSDVPAEFQRTPGACVEWVYDGIPFDGGHRP
jgi:hypothetical protein